jgi:hypothetical protein
MSSAEGDGDSRAALFGVKLMVSRAFDAVGLYLGRRMSADSGCIEKHRLQFVITRGL